MRPTELRASPLSRQRFSISQLLRMAGILLLMAICFALPAHGPALAQGTQSGAANSYDDLQKAMDEASRTGSRVIVIEAPGSASGVEAQPGAGSASSTLDAYSSLTTDQDKVVSMTQATLKDFSEALRKKFEQAPMARDSLVQQLTDLSPTGDPIYFAVMIGLTLLYITIGVVLTNIFYGRMLLKNWFVSLMTEQPEGLAEKLPILLLRAVFGLIGTAIAMAIGAGIGFWMHGAASDEASQKTLILVFATFFVVNAMTLTWRVVLAPYLSRYRIPSLNDSEANRLFHWLWITGALALIFQAYCVWLNTLELSDVVHALQTMTLTAVTVVLIILMVVFNNSRVAKAIRRGRTPERATWPSRWAARLWGPAVIVYSVAAWTVMSWRLILDHPPGPPLIVSAYVVMVSALAVYGVSAFVLNRLFTSRKVQYLPPEPAQLQASPATTMGGDDDEGGGARMIAAPPPPPRRRYGQMNSFEALAGRVASIFAVTAGIWALFNIWAVEGLNRLGEWTERLDDLGAIILIGYVAFHALRIYIDKRIEEEGGYEVSTEPGEGEGGGAGATRLATLLPLFRNFLLTTITVTVCLVIALELGVNVAPLFAGAGVVGLALGFGAQALVRDVLSGAFFLVDDAFRKGEYIDLGTVKGTVERISVRSFQLRHHLGYLHTVPFGEIQHMTNFSRDWVIMKLPIRLTYDTDAEHVRKLIKKLGQELLEDPEHGSKFVQPLKSQGVINMEDSAMIMRVKFMTKPGDQWTLRKVIFAKIRELFEKEGIPFAHREVTVRLADNPGRPLTEEEKEAVSAAAFSASEEASKMAGGAGALSDER